MFRKLKEEPVVDERIPHPYREVIRELKAIREELEQIKQRLSALVPPAPPVPPATREKIIEMYERGISITEIARELRVSETIVRSVVIVVPPVAPVTREVYVEALREYGSLLLAEDLHVETIDLGKDRSTAAKIEEFPKLKGIGLTIFKNTGTFDLYINEKDDYHKLTFAAITYPATFLLDWFRAETFYVGNAVQTGKEVILVAWKRI